jgi:hypothetical protein
MIWLINEVQKMNQEKNNLEKWALEAHKAVPMEDLKIRGGQK